MTERGAVRRAGELGRERRRAGLPRGAGERRRGRARSACTRTRRVYDGSGSTDDQANFFCQTNAQDDPALLAQEAGLLQGEGAAARAITTSETCPWGIRATAASDRPRRRYAFAASSQSRNFQVRAPSRRRTRIPSSTSGSSRRAFTPIRLAGLGDVASQCVTQPQRAHRTKRRRRPPQAYACVFSFACSTRTRSALKYVQSVP